MEENESCDEEDFYGMIKKTNHLLGKLVSQLKKMRIILMRWKKQHQLAVVIVAAVLLQS